jgi:predicted kinase
VVEAKRVTRLGERDPDGSRPVSREPPVVALLVGLPGAGKTTLARELGRLMPDLLVLSRDTLRAELYERPDLGAEEKRATFEELLRRLGARLGQGGDALVEGMPFSRRAERDAVARLARARGALPFTVLCDLPVELAAQRVARDAGGGPADRRPALVRAVAARFEPLEHEDLRLAMTDDPVAGARTVAAALGQRRTGARPPVPRDGRRA